MRTAPNVDQIFSYLSGSLVGYLVQLAQNPVGDRLADRADDRIVLQHLAADVERHVFGIDDAAHEAQIAGQDICIVGDEHAADIELQLGVALRVEQVERPLARHEQEHGVLVAALRLVVQGERRSSNRPATWP